MMPAFNTSVIKIITIPGDATNIYALIDANIYADAVAGLTAPQKALVDSYLWVPAALDFTNGCSAWAGNDPPPLYFKATQAKMQAALAKYYK